MNSKLPHDIIENEAGTPRYQVAYGIAAEVARLTLPADIELSLRSMSDTEMEKLIEAALADGVTVIRDVRPFLIKHFTQKENSMTAKHPYTKYPYETEKEFLPAPTRAIRDKGLKRK